MRNYSFSIYPEDSLDHKAKLITINNEDLKHQIINVLRISPETKEEISFIDGIHPKVYLARALTAVEKSKKKVIPALEFEIIDIKECKRELKQKVTALIPIIKADAMAFMIRKLSELGVSEMIAVNYERSQKMNIDHYIKSEKTQRYQKIIREATEQCEGAVFAELKHLGDLAQSLQTTLSETENSTLKIYASERLAEEKYLGLDTKLKLLKNVNEAEKLVIAIGPEGGLSDREVGIFEEHHFEAHSLGLRLLKAETAALSLFAKILL